MFLSFEKESYLMGASAALDPPQLANDDDDIPDHDAINSRPGVIFVESGVPSPERVAMPSPASSSSPVLRLEQFCQPPSVDFGTGVAGATRERTLTIVNPGSARRATVEFTKLPEGVSVSVEGVLTVAAGESVEVTVCWTAAVQESAQKNFRESMHLKWNKRFPLRVVLLGVSVSASPQKKRSRKHKQTTQQPRARRPSMATKVVQPRKVPARPRAGTAPSENTNQSNKQPVRRKPSRTRARPASRTLKLRRRPSTTSTASTTTTATATNTNTTTTTTTTSSRERAKAYKPRGKLQTKRHTLKPSSSSARSAKIFYDDQWADKQERGFVQWLNFVLEAQQPGAAEQQEPKTLSEFQALTALREDAMLRRNAFGVFHSREFETVMYRVDREIAEGKLVIRGDRDIHEDVGIRQHIMSLLFGFDLRWLRLGVETVTGRIIHCSPREDPLGEQRKLGIERFLNAYFFRSAALEERFAYAELKQTHDTTRKIVRFRAGYSDELKKHTLRLFIKLLAFLDHAKVMRLMPSDPCLFQRTNRFKSTRDVLVDFAKEYLSGEGDVTRHMAMLGVPLAFEQTPHDELEFGVASLAVDLRDGVRLSKLAEILINKAGGVNPDDPEHEPFVLVRKLRLPTDSRLRKVFNVNLALASLVEAGVPIRVQARSNKDIEGVKRRIRRFFQATHCTDVQVASGGRPFKANDIVDGFREKTLALLWTVVLYWDIRVLVDEQRLAEEIRDIHNAARPASSRASTSAATTGMFSPSIRPNPDDSSLADEMADAESLYMTSGRLRLLLNWVRTVCQVVSPRLEETAGERVCVPVHNFTTTFADGRVLCMLLHYYHPQMLRLDDIQMVVDPRAQALDMHAQLGDAGDNPVDNARWMQFYDMHDVSATQAAKNQAAARHNLHLVSRCVEQLGCVPLMLHATDTASGLPDEKVMITFVSYLCSRLLSLSKEVHATRKIQKVWRQALARRQAKRTLQRLRAEAQQRAEYEELLAAQRAERERQLAAERAQREKQLAAERAQREEQLAAQRRQQAERLRAVTNGLRVVVRIVERVQKRAVLTHLHDSVRFEDAALTVQCAWRCYRARQLVQDLRALRAELERRRMQKKHEALSWGVKQLTGTLFRAAHEAARIRAATVIQASWRATVQKRRFEATRTAALTVQAFVRASIARQRFQRTVRAATTVQSVVRMYNARSSFVRTRDATVAVQAWTRAVQQRKAFVQMCESAVVLQCAFRCFSARRQLRVLQREHEERTLEEMRVRHAAATKIQSVVRMYNARVAFLRTQDAVLAVQAWARAVQQRQAFVQTRESAMVLQRAFRCFSARRQLAGLRAEHAAQVAAQHAAATKIQSVVRMYGARVAFLCTRDAAVAIQAWTRAVQQRQAFMQTRESAVVLQRAFRCFSARRQLSTLRAEHAAQVAAQHAAATKIQSVVRMYVARSMLLRTRNAAITLQAWTRTVQQRKAFVQTRESAVVLQRAFRCFSARRQLSTLRTEHAAQVAAQHAAATKIQSAMRMYVARSMFLCTRDAAVAIQAWTRAVQQRKAFVQTRESAMVLQRAFRCFSARRQLSTLRAAHAERVNAIIKIQAWLRGAQQRRAYAAQLAAEAAAQQLAREEAAVTIQAAVRGFVERKRFTILRVSSNHAARVIQRVFRGYLSGRIYRERMDAIVTIQRFARAFLAKRRRAKQLEWASVTVQAWWRGYLVRRTSKPKVKALRVRLRDAEKAVRANPELSIRHRTRSALALLLESRRLTVVSEACRNLAAVTRLLRICCEEAVRQGAVAVILALMQSCNRSKPHLQLVRYGIDVLINLARCRTTSRHVFEQHSVVEVLVEQMQIYRDKVDIFSQAVVLLRIGTKHSGFAAFVVSHRGVVKRMQSIHKLLSRKINTQLSSRNERVRKEAAKFERGLRSLAKLLDVLRKAQ